MKTRLVRQVPVLGFALTLGLIIGFPAEAQSALPGQSAVAGPLSFSFTNSSVPVFDLTGSYQVAHEVAMAGAPSTTLQLTFALKQDAAGRLLGTGTTNILVGTNKVEAQYSVTGRVSGGGGKATRATVSVRWTGQGAEAVAISLKYNFVVSPGYLDGFARGKAKLGSSRAASVKAPVSDLRLPAGADGSWAIDLNLQPPGGSGSVKLSNRRSLQVSPRVTQSGRSGQERIKLTGTGADRGTTLNIVYLPASGVLQSVTGKVLGQTVNTKAAGAATVSQINSQVAVSSTFAGSQACMECHTPIQQTLNFTRHAQIGVQCENCHGPAAAHAANDYDPQSRPVIPYDGKSCGTCHSGSRHPVYEEWKTSEHAEVATDLNPPDRITACGRCHSGSVHVSLLDGAPLPSGDVNVPLGCPSCHQPHQLTGQPNQLRNPLYSTNDYYITTSSIYTNNYNPNINLCAQCHNHRGASWTSSSRPPHESPQYNILLGTVGELDSGAARFDPGYHGLFITNQCVGCHMQTSPYGGLSQPAVKGHTFEVNSYAACAGCHGSAINASNSVVFWSGYISNRVVALRDSLNQWATTQAPAIIGTTQYGPRAWEYTAPGALAPEPGPGPNAAQQALIAVGAPNIQRARFNLYLVFNDGSFGVHNPFFSLALLDTAQNWVDQELSP